MYPPSRGCALALTLALTPASTARVDCSSPVVKRPARACAYVRGHPMHSSLARRQALYLPGRLADLPSACTARASSRRRRRDGPRRLPSISKRYGIAVSFLHQPHRASASQSTKRRLVFPDNSRRAAASMPPRLPRRRKPLDADGFSDRCHKRLEAKGTSANAIVDRAIAAAPGASAWNKLQPTTEALHKAALDKFDRYLRSCREPVIVRGRPMRSLEDWKSGSGGYPSLEVAGDFLTWHVDDEHALDRVISKEGLRKFDQRFHSALRRALNIFEQDGDHDALKMLHSDLAKKKDLPDTKRTKALMTIETLEALQRAIVSGRIRWKPRRRLTVATFSARATQTSLRPSG